MESHQPLPSSSSAVPGMPGTDTLTVVTRDNVRTLVRRSLLMSKSAVFRQTLDLTRQRRSQRQELRLHYLDASVFHAILDHWRNPAQCRANQFEGELAEQLLVASDKYQLIDIKRTCERHFSNHLQPNNVIHLYRLAMRANARLLLVNCIHHYRANRRRVLQSLSDQGLPRWRPVIAVFLFAAWIGRFPEPPPFGHHQPSTSSARPSTVVMIDDDVDEAAEAIADQSPHYPTVWQSVFVFHLIWFAISTVSVMLLVLMFTKTALWISLSVVVVIVVLALYQLWIEVGRAHRSGYVHV